MHNENGNEDNDVWFENAQDRKNKRRERRGDKKGKRKGKQVQTKHESNEYEDLSYEEFLGR